MELAEDLVLLVAVCSLEFLLDEARAMLVSAELNDVVVDILELIAFVGLAVVSKVFEQRASNLLAHVMVSGRSSRDLRAAKHRRWRGHRIVRAQSVHPESSLSLHVVRIRKLVSKLQMILLRHSIALLCLLLLKPT